MMRPLRAFIMPRITALRRAVDAGQVGVEDGLPVLVLHPHQQVVAGDAGVVDQDRDRRRIPWRCARSAPRPTRASVTSSTRPWPPCAASRSPIACAPASEVAVPMTVAPCAASSSAIAAPMPRLAPVTSAIFAAVRGSSCGSWIGSLDAHAVIAIPSISAASNSAGVPSARASSDLSMRLTRPASTLPGPHSAMRVDAARGQRLHATGPLHRQVQLAHQRVADRCRRRRALRASTFCTTGSAGTCQCTPRHRFGQAVGGFAHQRRVRRHADRELHRLAHAALGQQRDRAIDRRGVAADHDLARRIVSWPAPRPRSPETSRRRLPRPAHPRRRAPPPSRRCRPARRPASAGRAGAPGARASCKRQRAGGDQRGVFAQAVAGQHAPACAPPLRLPRAPHRHAGGQQRRLGVFGAVEHALPGRPATAPTGRRRRRREASSKAVADAGMQLGEFGQHADATASPGRETRRRVGGWRSRIGHARCPRNRVRHDTSECAGVCTGRMVAKALGHHASRRDAAARKALQQSRADAAAATGSVAQQRRAPGEAAAEGLQQQQLAALHACPSAPLRPAPAAPSRTRCCRAGRR